MEKSKVVQNIKFYGSFIIIAILLIYIVVQLVAPDVTVRIFGFKPYIVITDSMEPEINVNDLVIITNFDIEELEVDDIITFYADVNYDGDTEIVTHYIYSITSNGNDYTIRTRRYFDDEADYVPDPWVLDQDSVLGQYSFHIPWIGTIGSFLQSPFGIAAVIVNIGIIVGIVYLIKQGEPEKKEPEAEEKA